MTPLIWVPRIIKFIETESKTVVTKGWGRGNKELFNGTEFQFGNDKNILEIDSCDGCTTIWMYLMPTNCTL